MNKYLLCVYGCVAFTVYGQIILKWRLMNKGPLPDGCLDKAQFLIRVLFDPFVVSALAAAFVASLFWMAAMTKLDISVAYPFTSLAFVLVLIFSALLFHEPITLGKVLGLMLIVIGIFVTVRL